MNKIISDKNYIDMNDNNLNVLQSSIKSNNQCENPSYEENEIKNDQIKRLFEFQNLAAQNGNVPGM